MKQLSICFLFILSIQPGAAFGQQSQNPTGEIYGTVYQRTLERGVASAQVRIVETGVRITTDSIGEFRFRNLLAGEYTLTATASGYRAPSDVVVTVKPGETTQLEIYLEPDTIVLGEVEVTAERSTSTVGRESLGGSEIQRVPGAIGDALRALQALPSVGVANDFSGALFIRGGSDEDNLYYFDRVPIGYPYHFGGIVSSLSSEIIERIDVYAGGYGAEFGVDSQAVIDIYSRKENADGFRSKFNVNLLYSEGLVEGKLGERGFWYAAGRRSYIDLFLGSLSFNTGQITSFPRFWDYQVKGGYDLSEKHQLSMNLFASGDRFALKLDGEDVDQDFRGDLNFGSGFEGAGIHLRSRLTNRLSSFLSLTRSYFEFDVNIGAGLSLKVDSPQYILREDLAYTLTPKHQLESGVILGIEPGTATGRFARPPDEGFRGDLNFGSGFEGAGIHLRSRLTNRLSSFLSLTRSYFEFDVNIGAGLSLKVDSPQYILREDLAYTLTPIHQLESGVILGIEPGTATGRFARPPDEGEADYDLRFVEKVAFDESVLGRRMEIYLQDRYRVLPFLAVVLGLRGDYLNRIDELSLQPRGSLLLEIPGGSQLQFAYGNYNQAPGPPRLTQSVGNPNLSTSQASHYVLEFTRQVSPTTEFKVAGYYKNLVDLVTFDADARYLNQGVGYAQGTEVFLRHRAGERFLGWASYAYGLSKRRDRPGEPYRYYSFDQTHVATFAATYSPTPTWEIGAKWQYRTGNPYTPVLGANLRADPRNGEPIYIPIYGATNSARFPPYHRLDVKLSKAFRFESWEMRLFLELLNVYNRKNLLDFNYTEDYSDKDEIYQFPILPYLGVTTEF